MVPTATKQTTSTPETLTLETLKKFCEKHPSYQKYLAEEAKLHELTVKLSSIKQEISDWQGKWQAAHEVKNSQAFNREKLGQFLDTGTLPKTNSIFEELKENRQSLQDQRNLLEGTIELQKERVMFAKNDWAYSSYTELRPLFLKYFRGLLVEHFRVYKLTEELQRLRNVVDTWGLPSHVFQGFIPGFRYIGQAEDFYSGMRAALRSLQEDGLITMEEMEALVQWRRVRSLNDFYLLT